MWYGDREYVLPVFKNLLEALKELSFYLQTRFLLTLL